MLNVGRVLLLLVLFAMLMPNYYKQQGCIKLSCFNTSLFFMSGIRESNPPPRLGKPVHYRCANSAFLLYEPIRGLEPRTHALRMRCSTNWAISAIAVAKVMHLSDKTKFFYYLFLFEPKNSWFYIRKIMFMIYIMPRKCNPHKWNLFMMRIYAIRLLHIYI